MQHILLVEDSVDICAALTRILEKEYRVSVACTISDAREKLQNGGSVDLVLLDVELPDGTGTKFCSYMKDVEEFKDIPVIFLTGYASPDDKAVAFSVGADDYIVKPFESRELKARVKARLNTSLKRKVVDDVQVQGNLVLNIPLQKAILRETPEIELTLTSLEFKLLLYFARHEDHVFQRDQLISAIWGDNTHVLDRTIDRHVSVLRKQLARCSHTIETVRGMGYRFAKNDAAVLKKTG